MAVCLETDVLRTLPWRLLLQIDYMTYVLNKVDPEKGPNYKLAKEFGFQLLENCKEVVGTAPLYKDGECRSSES